jgi:hypothetical protein
MIYEWIVSWFGNKLETKPIIKDYTFIVIAVPFLFLKDRSKCESCAICLDGFEEFSDTILMHCNHVYHSECIKGWIQQHRKCPLCMRNIV